MKIRFDCVLMTISIDSRAIASLSTLGSCRLSITPGHGVLLPARGMCKRGTSQNWSRNSRSKQLRVCTHRQGLWQDQIWDLRQLLPANRADCAHGNHPRRQPTWAKFRTSPRILAKVDGEELGFGVLEVAKIEEVNV